MIKIRPVEEIEKIKCDVFINGEYIGILTTELQLLDLRLQIKTSEEKISAYMMCKGRRIDIDKNGNCSHHPFDYAVDTLLQLI